MTKILKVLLVIFMIVGITPICAEEKHELSDYIEYTDSFSATDALEIAYTGTLSYGDKIITNKSIEAGLEYAKYMEQQSTKQSKVGSADYEVWTLTSQKVLVGYSVLKGKYLKKVPAGASVTNRSVSITLGGTIKGIDIGASITLNNSVTYSGPSGTDLVKTGVYATHRYYSILASGQIEEYTYRVTNRYTGAFIKNATLIIVTNGTTNIYSNLGALNASTNYLTYRSATSNSTKYMSENSFISNLNSDNPWPYVGF